MSTFLPTINPEKERQKIVSFLKKTFAENKIDNAMIGLSGGIDSTLSFFLLKEALPLANIHVVHMYYDSPKFENIEKVLTEIDFPEKNIKIMSIKKSVDIIAQEQNISNSEKDRLRLGNIKARIRMIILFDLAKKHNALVCGTENKSENLLGYFTRFGDQASDIEPITTLYKTHVFELAKYLKIPINIINQAPSAGLWDNQTDEKEFGFTYSEADQILYLYLEKKYTLDKMEKMGFNNAKKVIDFRSKNLFKHHTPYSV